MTGSDAARVTYERRGATPGPTLLVMTLIHGNEPAGHEAAARVAERVETENLPLRGEWIVLRGNVAAARARTRFVDEDLNRRWAPGSESRDEGHSEERERKEIRRVLQQASARATGPLRFLDLHTSSATGPPFLTVGDTLRNRRFARRFILPRLLGLEEQVDGSLLEYLNNLGFVTLGVEAGQHEAPAAREIHEAVLWVALTEAGLLEARCNPGLETAQATLAAASRGLPHVLEVRYRHALQLGSGFVMDGGHTHFEPVRRGQRLAEDRAGPVLAPLDGRLLLPLYQGQGNDGFFIGTEVGPLWLAISALARWAGLPELLRVLPGVKRHAEQSGTLVVDTRIARYFPLVVFRVGGYRKVRRVGPVLLVARRDHDRVAPRRIEIR